MSQELKYALLLNLLKI